MVLSLGAPKRHGWSLFFGNQGGLGNHGCPPSGTSQSRQNATRQLRLSPLSLFWGSPSPRQVREKEELENEWNKLEAMAAFVQVKQAGRGPDDAPSQAEMDQFRKSSRRQRSQYDDYNYMTTYYTPYYVGDAAGCGGGDGGCGAGCGDGACGGGASGGGGGCGGGG